MIKMGSSGRTSADFGQPMKLTVDTDGGTLVVESSGESVSMALYSDEAFEVLSRLWLKVGWNQKYTYTFTWFGRPIIQLPEDLVRLQEVIYQTKPDVVVETGVAHGGSAVFYASLLEVIGRGRVIGVDISIRPHNREAMGSHQLASRVSLIEGSSTDPAVVAKVRSMIAPGESVLVVLDSRHDKDHVLRELELYGPIVTPGSYIVATDGIMRDLPDVPRGRPNWVDDNPAAAAVEFAAHHPEFTLEQPAWPFNESNLTKNVTYWPNAWLHRSLET
jgi:cephalosporin hydroxylase